MALSGNPGGTFVANATNFGRFRGPRLSPQIGLGANFRGVRRFNPQAFLSPTAGNQEAAVFNTIANELGAIANQVESAKDRQTAILAQEAGLSQGSSPNFSPSSIPDGSSIASLNMRAGMIKGYTAQLNIQQELAFDEAVKNYEALPPDERNPQVLHEALQGSLNATYSAAPPFIKNPGVMLGQTRINSITRRAQEDFFRFQQKKQEEETKTLIQLQEDIIDNAPASPEGNIDRLAAAEKLRSLLLSESASPEEVELVERGIADRMVTGTILANFENIPTTQGKQDFIAQIVKNKQAAGLRIGKGGTADKVIKTLRARLSDIKFTEKQEETELSRQEQRERAAVRIQLEEGVETGQTTKQVVDQAFEKEILTPTQAARLENEVEDYRRGVEEINLTGELITLATINEERLPFNLNDKEQVATIDSAFERVNLPYIQSLAQQAQQEGKDPGEVVNNEIVNFALSTGHVPTQIQNQIRLSFRQGTPEQKADAALLLDKLMTANIDLIRDMDDEDRQLALTISSNMRAGFDPGESVDMAQEAMDPRNEHIRQANEQRANELLKTPRNSIDAVFQGQGKRRFFGLLEGDPEIPIAQGVRDDMTRIYNESFMAAYRNSGNEEAAREYAEQNIKKFYGVTTIDGKPRVEKYPVERYWGANGNTEWVKQQLAEDLVGAGMVDPKTGEAGQPGTFKGGKLKDLSKILDNIFLFGGDKQSEAEATEGVPSYRVMFKDKDGMLNEAKTTSGKALRFTPNPGTSGMLQEFKKVGQENVEKARQKRQRRIQQDKKVDELVEQGIIPRPRTGLDALNRSR